MVFDISIVITWFLFLALFPMAFFWLRRAWRIFIKRDYSEVALKRGEAPPNPEKWAPVTGTVNLLAGGTSIETCQSCHRLLYTQAMLDDTPHTPDMPDMPSEG